MEGQGGRCREGRLGPGQTLSQALPNHLHSPLHPSSKPLTQPNPTTASSPQSPQPTPARPSVRLVKVYGACTADRAHVALIMELLEGGSLHQRIYDRCRRRMGYLEILQVDWGGPTAGAA